MVYWFMTSHWYNPLLQIGDSHDGARQHQFGDPHAVQRRGNIFDDQLQRWPGLNVFFLFPQAFCRAVSAKPTPVGWWKRWGSQWMIPWMMSMAGAVLQRAERRARDAGNGEELQLEGLELSNGLAHVTCRGRGADGPSSYSIYIIIYI